MNNIVHLTDNNTQGTLIKRECIQDVLQISSIGRLRNAPDLLVFPHSFSDLKDGIGDLSIVTLHEAQYADGKCISARACTGNLMGFVGINETSLSIHSRFTHKKDNGEVDPSSPDYFLYYMLQKVFSVNVFSLEHASSRDDKILDFLLFLFPLMLKNAMSQGLYKEYRRFQHDDDRVKGTIDVNRFIRLDIPFRGNLSYTFREYSYDNTITQLVRHTIEYITHHPFGNSILNNDSETIEYVRQIKEATPSYCLRDRQRVLNENRRPKVHPYFTRYRELQQLCVHILRHESLKYGQEKDKVYGILFDGAWLWEEYLGTILERCGFTHSENLTGKNPITLYKGNLRYPDFYKTEQINKFKYGDSIPDQNDILDAKYKPLDSKSDRDDIHQIITYMHILPSKRCGLLYPCEIPTTPKEYEVYGIGGKIRVIGLNVSHACDDFSRYVEAMNKEELDLISKIK